MSRAPRKPEATADLPRRLDLTVRCDSLFVCSVHDVSEMKMLGQEAFVSKWYTVADDGIEIDDDTKTVDLYLGSDNEGSLYATVTFDQIRSLHSKIETPNAAHEPPAANKHGDTNDERS